jgi:hypothetical protein
MDTINKKFSQGTITKGRTLPGKEDDPAQKKARADTGPLSSPLKLSD